MKHKMETIQTQFHQLRSYQINKISLSCFDNKCYILKNGIKTLAYGHKDIKQIKANVSIEWNQGFILLTLINSFKFVSINVKAKCFHK